MGLPFGGAVGDQAGDGQEGLVEVFSSSEVARRFYAEACARYQQRGLPPSAETGPFTVEAVPAATVKSLDEIEIGHVERTRLSARTESSGTGLADKSVRPTQAN